MHFAAFGGVDFEPDDLALEMARLGRRLAAAVAFERIGVEIVLGQTVFLDDHFGAHELAEHDAGIFYREPFGLIMAEPFLDEQRRDAAHRDARHAFDAAREDDVLRARHHRLRRELDRLLRRAALAVDGDRGDRVGELRGEHGVAADVPLLPPALPYASVAVVSRLPGVANLSLSEN